MVCPRCGAENAANGGRCKNCNAVLTSGGGEMMAATMTPAPTPASDAPRIAATGSARTATQTGQGPLKGGDSFGPRYRILKVLGAGGMGVVYHAWDDELGMALALKVIRPEVMADAEAARAVERRFKRELLLARQVTHRNVVRIHDLGEVGGIKYLTMPFVEGRNLGTILREEGALPVSRALRIAKQVASGLQAAHEAGVVHRDLKPENIMIDEDDHALIMDFGISRSLSGTGAGTMMGAVVGTLEYMAPEQGRGQPADQRADIYAFGLMLYDMIAGRKRLQSADSAVAEMMSRMTKAPPKLGTRVGNMPEPLESIVARCVDPDPAKRYQTTTELVADLTALDAEGRRAKPARAKAPWQAAAIGALVLAAAAAGTAWWVTRSGRPPNAAVRDPVSVLIADFDNQARDPVFDGALEQALGIAIEGAPFISAYQRNTAKQIADRRLKRGTRLDLETARLVANSEGVNIVLAGSIASEGSGYRLRVQALDVDGKTLAQREESATSKLDVLQAIGTLAADIREDLGDTSSLASRRADAETFSSTSLDALQAFARGNDLNRSGKPREGLAAFEEAVRLDPEFAMAYVHIGSIYTNLKMEDKSRVAYDAAFKHLDRMTEREKYRTLGSYYLDARNYKEAITNYGKLVELYPADNTGVANLALAYLYDRRVPQAVEMGRTAIEIYPKNILQRTNYATYSMYAGDFRTAREHAQHVLKENPTYEWAGLTLALSTLADGDESGARENFDRLSRASTLGASLASMGLADFEMYSGRPAAALTILDEGVANDEREKNSSNLALKLVAAAEAHMMLGNRAAALQSADRATMLYRHEAVLVPAAAGFVQLGRVDRAQQLVKSLQETIPIHLRSYARVINGIIALNGKRLPDAINELQAAREMHDSWYVHDLLGRAYFATGKFREAMAQWEECVRRRGEATDVFFADTSSLRYLPPVYYWLGRAKEEVSGRDAAADDYRKYLGFRRSAERDPLAPDAQQRLSR